MECLAKKYQTPNLCQSQSLICVPVSEVLQKFLVNKEPELVVTKTSSVFRSLWQLLKIWSCTPIATFLCLFLSLLRRDAVVFRLGMRQKVSVDAEPAWPPVLPEVSLSGCEKGSCFLDGPLGIPTQGPWSLLSQGAQASVARSNLHTASIVPLSDVPVQRANDYMVMFWLSPYK